MEINSVQGLNAYTATQPRQEDTQAATPVQPAETEQTGVSQEAAVVEISQEASAQLAAEETTEVQPPPAQQAPDQNQPPAQQEQPTSVINIVA